MSSAEPRHHTPRNPDRQTLGPMAGKVAAMLGIELMPWQQRAADVILEIDPATGRFAYPYVVLTVPRQAGKTALVLVLALHRALMARGQQVWYTAQTGQAARKRFLEDLAEKATDPKESRIAPLLDLKQGAGDTKLTVKGRRSVLRPHPPTANFSHGDKSDLNIIDECFDFEETKAKLLEQAIGPTQNTRERPQTIYVSTMGDASSVWWHTLVDEVRAGKPGWAIIDYGIADGVDPSDLDAVVAAHPAVGHTTPRQAIIDAASRFTAGEFARAYGNRPTLAREAILSAEQLDRMFTDEPIRDGAPFALAAATSFDRTETAVVAAALDLGGHPIIEVLDVRPGTEWAVALMRTVTAARQPVAVVADPNSPTAVIADQLSSTDTEDGPPFLLPITAREISTATDDMLRRAGLRVPEVRFRFHDSMRRSWEFATLRYVAETGRMWSRKHSTGSIACLEAATLALHGLTHQPPVPEPAHSRIA